MKFLKNPSCECRVVPCGHTDRQTDRHDEVIAAFRNFAKVLKNVNARHYFGTTECGLLRDWIMSSCKYRLFPWKMTCESQELCAFSLFNGLTLCIRIYMRERMHEIENNGIDFVCDTHGMEDSNCARNFGRK